MACKITNCNVIVKQITITQKRARSKQSFIFQVHLFTNSSQKSWIINKRSHDFFFFDFPIKSASRSSNSLGKMPCSSPGSELLPGSESTWTPASLPSRSVPNVVRTDGSLDVPSRGLRAVCLRWWCGGSEGLGAFRLDHKARREGRVRPSYAGRDCLGYRLRLTGSAAALSLPPSLASSRLSLSPSLPFSPCPCFYHSFQFIFESIALFFMN